MTDRQKHFNVLKNNTSIQAIQETNLPFVGVIGFLLHYFQDSPTSIGAIVWVSIDSNGLFQGPHVILPMYIHSTIQATAPIAYYSCYHCHLQTISKKTLFMY
jgi:hypothetical protein